MEKNNNKQLICIISVEKQLFVILFNRGFRVQIIENRSVLTQSLALSKLWSLGRIKARRKEMQLLTKFFDAKRFLSEEIVNFQQTVTIQLVEPYTIALVAANYQ